MPSLSTAAARTERAAVGRSGFGLSPVLWGALRRALAQADEPELRKRVSALVAGLADRAAGVRAIRAALSERVSDEEEVLSEYCDWIDRWKDEAHSSEPRVEVN